MALRVFAASGSLLIQSTTILPLLGDRGKASAVAFQHRLRPRELLPPPHRHVHVPRIQLHEPCLSPRLGARNQGASRTPERIQNDRAAVAAIVDGALDQGHWFHRGMEIIDWRPIAEPHIPLVPCPTPIMLPSFGPTVQNWLELPLIVASAQRERI